ncbi:MAG TPA: murein biosynthesis integral membrane protein MurJ [Campylobacterales bacterium]|nr:murein biosynthesis integral membrane protein MurJ [Campylobacterales bacterium]
MFKSIFTNSAGILTSRVLGFVRDMLTASALGAGVFSDIFFIAFKLPNLFRNIFAEGAFSQSFIPSFAASPNKPLFSVVVFVRLMAVIMLMSLFVTIFKEAFTAFTAFGYSDEIKKMAAPIVAINFFYLDLIFIVTFLGALLQYRKHFATTAFSTALLNVAMITSLFIAKDMEKLEVVYALSWGVLVGGVLQVAVHIFAAKKRGVLRLLTVGVLRAFRGDKRANGDVKKFNRSFLPSIAGSSTSQISAFVDVWLATFLATGAISYLYYANRIFQLPLAVFAIATSMALFPSVARALNRGEEAAALLQLKKAFWFLSFLLVAFTIGGIILSKEVIWLIYEHGRFARSDTDNTSIVMAMYMIGLVPFGLSRLFSLWLYSKHQQLKAAKISAISLLFNVVFSLILMRFMGAAGLALSGSLTGFILFFLTLKAFGFERLKTFFDARYAIALVISLAVLVATLLFAKGIIDAYLRL